MDDVTVSAVRGYTWADMRPYAVSLSRSGFVGRKVLFAENIPDEMRKNLLLLGFEIYDYATPPRLSKPCPARLRRFNPPELPEYLYWANEQLSPMINFLRSNLDIGNVIKTDWRDVIFQTNPSIWLNDNLGDKKIVVQGLGHPSMGCRYNEDFIYGAAKDDEEFINTRCQETVTFGTFAGRHDDMLDLMTEIYLTALHNAWAVEQGTLNILVRGKYKDRVKVASTKDIFSTQTFPGAKALYFADYVPPVFDEVAREVRTPDGELFSIVHNYDRDKKWLAIMQEKYA